MSNSSTPPVFLLVEDIPVNRLLLRKLLLLQIPHAVIHEADNGQAAIDILKTESIDIVFMDVHMPVMDGLQATAVIRSMDDHKQVPIVALSAGIQQEEKEMCLTAGMNAYLVKPLAVADLKTLLNEYLDS